MVELIERSTVIDVLKETGIIVDNDLGHLVVEEINRIPTTTEAEIRAKAYEEFAEKLKEEIRPIFDYYYDYQMWEKKIDYAAEQLKGNTSTEKAPEKKSTSGCIYNNSERDWDFMK